MNFDLTDEQAALQDVLDRFCRDRLPMTEVRRWGEAGGVDRGCWSQLAALGTFELATPGLAGGSLTDATVAYEVLGRHLVPGPLLGAAIAAGLVDGVANGSRLAVLIDERTLPTVAAHLAEADAVVVLGRDAVRLVDPGELTAIALTEPLDPTATTSVVEHLPEGERLGGAELSGRLRHAAGVLAASMLVGISDAATEQGVEHARHRRQFGRPIGTFQAVKHLLADSFVRTEVARAAVYAAAVVTDDPAAGDLRRASAAARHLAAEAAVRNSKNALQVLGGMGFTWEVDIHLYVKRAWALRAWLGAGSDLADLATLLPRSA